MKKLEVKWLRSQQQCGVVKEETPSLGLTKTLFAFAIVTGGVLVSLILLASEMTIGKWFVKGNKHRKKLPSQTISHPNEFLNRNSQRMNDFSMFFN